MSIQKQWAIPWAVLLFVSLTATAAQAQLSAGPSALGGAPTGYPAGYPGAMPPGVPPGYPPPGYGGGMLYGGRPVVATFDPASGAYYAPPGALPVVAGSDPLAEGATPPMPEGEEYESYDEEYYARHGHHEHMGLLGALLPYDEGGLGAPRWWDVYAEAIRFTRENVSRTVNFTSDGILGPVVLGSDLLDFQAAYGFKAGIAAQLSAGSNVEFNFLGALNFHTRGQAQSDTNNLYSTFSDFGSNPFGGFVETDASYFQDIAYSSTLNSFEMTYRRRWQGNNSRVQGSWLGGLRYVQLNEDFIYHTQAVNQTGEKFMTSTTSTINSLTGFQVGGDAWVTLIPGLRFGGEMKAGLYGNYTHQNTSIFATTIPDGLFERTGQNGVAFVGQLSLALTYRFNYHWTFRGGYDFLYLDGVALGIENFNSGPPFVAGQRTLFFNNNGDVFYHGATLGLEYLW